MLIAHRMGVVLGRIGKFRNRDKHTICIETQLVMSQWNIEISDLFKLCPPVSFF